jgi:triosephosphate isomerase (TIM)
MGYMLSNWKMYPARDEAVALFARVQDRLRRAAGELPVVVVCPPVVSLTTIAGIADRRLVRLGAQSCHWEASGPYTGETSPAMLAGLVDYVMVGHSERRRTGETDEQIARKVAAIADHGMTPILFVGEDEPTDAAAEQTEERLERGLALLDVASRPPLVVYEPTWAIGADEPAGAEHVEQLAVRLKQRLARKGAQRPTVIYGGTVSADNAGRFTAIDALDGVGATRGALDEDGFVAIVESVARADAAKRA